MISAPKPLLYLPVETAARELDAKLLLMLHALREGFDVILGNRQLLNRKIHRFPTGLYLIHNIHRGSRRMARLLKRLGHVLLAWDEEGLVWLNEQTYARRRVDLQTVEQVTTVFAWGREHAQALVQAGVPAEKILEAGNPRADLLRPPFRAIYKKKAKKLRRRYGDFILINSSFGWLNYAQARKQQSPEDHLREIAARSGHDLETLRLKHRLFQAFGELVPALAQRYPDRTVIIRPHPSEDDRAWADLARTHENVHVVRDSDLIPWLMACGTMIHNGCTTAVEYALLDRTPISFQPVTDANHDMPQPMRVSIPASSVEEAVQLAGREKLEPPAGWRPLLEMVSGLAEGRLSAAVVASELARQRRRPQPSPLASRGWSALRAAEKAALSLWPYSTSNPRYIAQKFPPMDMSALQDHIMPLCEVLDMDPPQAKVLGDRIFLLQSDGQPATR